MRISRSFLPVALLIAAFLLTVLLAAAAPAQYSSKYLFYVGTYTEDGSKSKGIYAYQYDGKTYQITPLGLAAETTNPSFVAFHPNGRFLYAVNEVGNYKGPNSGGVSAFSIDRATGKLTFLNEVPSRGADPCYITVDRTGKYVMVANYTGGSLAVFPVLADGKLGEASAFVQHTGHGTNPTRQEGPHAHSIDLSPDNRFAMVDDLGLDELLVYKFDSAKGSLALNDPPFTKLAAGSGPRHFVLRPDGKFAYVVSEMGHSVTAFSNDAAGGRLQVLQTVTTLPKDFTGRNDDAEIAVHPSGKFLYASNRGDDSIAIYTIDQSKGTLALVGIVHTGGKEPRSFEIDPTGVLLFAENQKSDNIVIFRIDQKTGQLTPTGQVLEVGSPVCLKFVAVE
ncbi:MAG: lactonase family protein [Candidatus Sulfotelmatobacter sp.]|jgi:6-phosphogluconolactonase